uniref:Crumbs cell polarity complex component 1 n=1 Tax=Salarias fasciatus TaxID=181472 RepID=A0A672HHJ6_SALFA
MLITSVGGNWALGGEEGEAETPAAFLGCFRDVFVDSRLVLPVLAPVDSVAQANITVGCSDREKCDDSPCQNRGRCVSHGWRSYTCECHRPYEGDNCAEEYVTARFGNGDLGSYALFSMDDDPGDALVISMFLRTRQASGLLLILANSTSQYLRLWLEGGNIRVQVNNFETLTGQAAVSDGHFHLVTVKLEGMAASLFQSTQNQGSMPIRYVQAYPGDLMFVGGLPDARAAASFGGYFKGCIQDLRINSKRLQFFPIAAPVESFRLEQLNNVAEGCNSNNACAVNPCLNGGVCYPMWDDFTCNCPPSTAGRRCQEVKWCELSPCPAASVCQPLSQGFECLSNVTFRPESGVLHYQSKGTIKRRFANVSISFRTRLPAATLLHAQKDSDYLTVSLLDSRLAVELQVYESPKVTLQSQGLLSDGEWHIVELSMDSKTPTSSWTMDVDGGKEVSLSKTAGKALDFLQEGGHVALGGLSPDGGANLSGCLGPVEIGGLLLPFHLDTDLNLPRPQEERFVRVNGDSSPRYGCWGSDVCSPNPCLNGGVCEDAFDLHRCTCPFEWAGPLCEEPADGCASGPCLFGNCSSAPGGFRCECEAGYSGEQCELEVDVCENSNCSHGATCLKGFQRYACLCPQNLTGQYCKLPRLPLTTCTGTRWNYSCFNGGNCSEADHSCYCLPGFTGQWYDTHRALFLATTAWRPWTLCTGRQTAIMTWNALLQQLMREDVF